MTISAINTIITALKDFDRKDGKSDLINDFINTVLKQKEYTIKEYIDVLINDWINDWMKNEIFDVDLLQELRKNLNKIAL